MPLYVYKCRGCGQQHEVLANPSDPPPKKSPCCGKKLERELAVGRLHNRYSPMHPRAGRGRKS